MSLPLYNRIVEHYRDCFMRHGATPKGVDWPKDEDVATRFAIMLGVTIDHKTPLSLLDLGCGYGAFLDWLMVQKISPPLEYHGIDLCGAMIDEAKKRHPAVRFEVRDILIAPLPADSVDFVVMNGVLTEKLSLAQAEMELYARQLIKEAFLIARRGIAFNVMSTHVDWRRDDLFHWSFDAVADFLTAEVSRHYSFRADYGLYEYTTYVYKAPQLAKSRV